MEEVKCKVCGSDYSDNYFKSKENEEIVCLECLLETFCSTSTTTHYYFEDGDYLGSDDEIDEVVEKICDYTDFEEIKE